jgi:hypothetical protein
MSAPRSLLEEVLPRFDASEVHDVWVPARPQVVFAGVKQVTVREVRLLMPLETLRALPSLLMRRRAVRPRGSAPLLDDFTVGVDEGSVLPASRPFGGWCEPSLGTPPVLSGGRVCRVRITRHSFGGVYRRCCCWRA